MPVTTTDELRAHRLLSRRLSAALLDGDAESTIRPLTRLGIGTYAGIFLTVVLLAIVGIAGVLRPGGSTAWSEPGAFVVERETGARYVYLDGVLHPVLNYASARLLLGEALHVVTVSGRSLETAPRGPVIGIPGASDSLPDRSHIVGTDWSVCAIGDAANPQPYRTTVYPGRATAGEALDGQAGYLLRTTAGRFLLLWSGHAHPVSDQWLPALGYRTATAVTVQDDFAAALPSGQLLAPPAIAGIGQPGPALPGSVAPVAVGSIFADRTNAYYLMTQGGLAALTPLQAGLLLADPRLVEAYGGSNPTPLPISQAQITDATTAPLPDPGPGAAAPTKVPELVPLPAGEQQLCVRYRDRQSSDIVVGPADPSSAPADGLVQLPVGYGALVAAQPAPTVPGTTVSLITDTGRRYPVAGPRALEQLGLAGVSVAQLPAAVVALLPPGPLLDPADAAQPVS